MNPDADNIHSTRWTLIRRLKDVQDSTSWKHFFDLYWKLVYRAALQAGCTQFEAEEVVQETVISVSKQIPQFEANPSRGSFKAWLLSLTRRRIVDQFRKRQKAVHLPIYSPITPPPGQARDEEPEVEGADPMERYWEKEWENHLLGIALERVKRQIPAKQFQIFHLLVVKQQNSRDVAKALGITTAQVYLTKHRVSQLVKKEIQSCERRGY